ncbi:uncharacterized protein LOC126265919 [Aethina tumida]|uniref:uncharacterized protein LOC126265919 n=1 Tax=Aethina tumida TaxID=116153 RepID=UPI002148384D|nr:uncharacterized protein LOC126265919 [Aethina tumida]
METSIKFVMLNAGRGREATDLFARKLEKEKIDIGILKEIYHGKLNIKGYKTYRVENGKVAIFVKKERGEVRTHEKWASKNGIMIKLERKKEENNIWLLNLYDEPGKNANEIKRVWDKEVKKIVKRKGIKIIAGDFNARSPSWGDQVYNGRGRRLEEWINENGYQIAEDASGIPTFRNAMGRSWPDIVMIKGEEIQDYSFGRRDT